VSGRAVAAQRAAAARAVADAFLTGPWDRAAMATRAAQVLGGPTRRLLPLARQVMLGYPVPPADRPRELATFVGLSEPFARVLETAARAGRPLHLRAMLPAPVRVVRPTAPAPPLDDAAALAARLGLDVAVLDWFADLHRMQRRAPAGPLHHYRYRWVQRRGAVPRLLEAPLPRLRQLQRTLLHEVVGLIPVHPAAHGFVAGRSAVTHAREHAGRQVVGCLDLVTFFAGIGAGRVYGVLHAAGYPEPVAHLLTGLCSTATPRSVIAAMPPGGDPGQRFVLRSRLASGHLPQGAPTSPHLANLVAARLDRRLAGYAVAAGLTYGRYADDLTFSGGGTARDLHRALAGATRIVTAEGFAVNPAKTRVRTRAQRQLVTGIVVNEHPTVSRADYDTLRAVLHDAARSGPRAANRSGHPDFRAHLLGRVAWVASMDADRGRRLRGLLEAVDWSVPDPVDEAPVDEV
jgi:hypothetical protein